MSNQLESTQLNIWHITMSLPTLSTKQHTHLLTQFTHQLT